MEVNSDLIVIQGLLTSAVKTTGEFSKIKYKGGNEMKINVVVKELEEYLVSKQYFDKRKRRSNQKYHANLESISLFLILNTEFKSKCLTEIKEFSHSLNIAPLLSKCLLANIVVDLDLCEYYCVAFQKLPLELSEELLCEFIPCIIRVAPKQSLEYCYVFISNIIKKLSSLDASAYEANEMIEKLEDISSEILLNASGINPDQVQGWSKLKVYKHMGVTLFKLLKLLQFCQVENHSLHKIIDVLISTACSVVKAVTIKVFCSWAEVQYKDQVLQIAIGGEAYYVVEKFQKYEPAEQLIQMLGSFAMKPKTLNEMIQEADLVTIVAKVNAHDSNQKLWFTALLNSSQIFDVDESIQCLNTWAKLCTVEDVTRLLNLSVNRKSLEIRKLIILCASHLNRDDLILVITRFFHQHGLRSSLDTGTLQSELTCVLNKLKNGSDDTSTKQILLMLLQNPVAVVTYLYYESLKSQVLLSYLADVFKVIEGIIQIECLSTRTLEKVMENVKPNADNISNYEKICKILMRITFSGDKLIEQMMKNYTEACLRNGQFTELVYAFQLYISVVDQTNEEQYLSMCIVSFNILENCRWKFFDFSYTKENLCEKCVAIALDYLKFSSERKNFPDIQCITINNHLNKYYISRLQSGSDESFFNYVCPIFDLNNHAEGVCYLVKLLPICVPKEWFFICEHLHSYCGVEKFFDLLSDALLLMCQVVKTQEKNETNNGMPCLKYCIQNYGTIIKDALLPLKSLDVDVKVTKSICRLLREIPTEARRVEGMSLLSLLPEESLKSLVQDKTFVCLLVAIGDSDISQIIAKKMLA